MNIQEQTDVWQLNEDPKEDGYLLVILHGRGDSPQGWINYLDELAIPYLSACLLRAPDQSSGGGYSWYPSSPNQLPGIIRSRKFLTEKFAAIHARGFPAERIILMGFSQGCLMTLEFGGRHPEKFAGYIGISGYCYDPNALAVEAPNQIKNANWLVTHGTQDDVLPFEDTQEQIEILKKGGFQIDFQIYKKAHTFDEMDEAPYVRDFILKCMKKH